MMVEHELNVYNGETLETLEAFRKLYIEQKHRVSWAQHPLSSLTGKFLDEVSLRNINPLIYDLGCGEGSKTFRLARENFRVVGIDAVLEGIDLAKDAAKILGLDSRISFIYANLLDIDPAQYISADGVHIYQCVTHVARKYHSIVAELVGSLIAPGGKFLTNDFNRNTTNFYDVDISQSETGEFEGTGKISGMRCYFFTEQELIDMYSPYFRVDELIPVKHHSIEGRFHWELLMTRKSV